MARSGYASSRERREAYRQLIAVLPLRQLLRRSQSGILRRRYDRRVDDGSRDDQRAARDLARLRDAVQGRTRPPTPEIAKLLNVDAVVEGSVVREGNRVRITAQLIDARADKHLWAHTYEGDSRDVLTLQDQMTAEIAGQVNIELTPPEQAQLANSHVVNPQAHEAYLRGRYYEGGWSPENLNKAISNSTALSSWTRTLPCPTRGSPTNIAMPTTCNGPKPDAAGESGG